MEGRFKNNNKRKEIKMTNKSTKFMAAFGLVAGIGVAAALPVTMAEPGHAATTATTEITATVDESISISTTTPTVAISLGVDDLQTATGNFTIATNHVGYTVSVVGSGTGTDATALVNGANSIGYASTVVHGTAGWNLKVGDTTPASITTPATVVTSDHASTSTGDPYSITYSVATSSNQAAGAYVGQVTYTASIGS